MAEAESAPVLRRTRDYATMLELGNRSGLESGTLEDVAVAYGFYVGERLVGCAALKVKADSFTIEALAVDERFRGRGLGSVLVGEIEREARSRGAKRLWAIARQPAFFEKVGYRKGSRYEHGAPNNDSCFLCPQYSKSCFPAIMMKDL